MIFKFNKGQLGGNLDAKLNGLLADIQKGCETEIVVIPLEFPEKFSIQAGNDVVVVAWDSEKSEYKILPSSVQESLDVGAMKMEGPNVGQKVESLIDTKLEPESDLDVKVKDLAERTYILMQMFLTFTPQQQIQFNKEYAKLWKG